MFNMYNWLVHKQNDSVQDKFSSPVLTGPLTPLNTLFANAQPQRAGAMSILPIIGPSCDGRWTSPYSGLKFTGVHGYGSVSFHNDSDGTAILPMHMGYIQDGAQNHAISTAAMLAKGESRRFDNARCVQASQGGYLKTQEQWFFILPLALREEMLDKRKITGCGELWGAIGRYGRRFGSSGRGHLDDVICKYRASFNEYEKEFELCPNQRGAVFFINDVPVGIEIGPTPEYFKDIWSSLICFCYGPSAWEAERDFSKPSETVKRDSTLEETRQKLLARRLEYSGELTSRLAGLDWTVVENLEEEKFLELSLSTIRTSCFYGQMIHRENKLIYASLFRTGMNA